MIGTALLILIFVAAALILISWVVQALRRAVLAAMPMPVAAAAEAATPQSYTYVAPDGAQHALSYEALPAALGRWRYATQSVPSFPFEFDLVPVGAVVRIYIVSQPDYGPWPDDLLATHRLRDACGHFICIKAGNEPVDGREAVTWFVYWAEATAHYILTGERFA